MLFNVPLYVCERMSSSKLDSASDQQARKSNHHLSNLVHCCPVLTLTLTIMQSTEDARTKKKPFLLISTRPVFEDENAPYPLQNEEDDFFRLSRPNYNIPPSFLPAKIAPILMSGVRRAFPSLPEFPTSVTFTRASERVGNADIKPKLTVASIVGRPKKVGAFPTPRDRNSSSSGREQMAGAAHYCMFFEIFAPK